MNKTYLINPETATLINELTAELRAQGNKDLALLVRKTYGNIKGKEFTSVNKFGVLAQFTGKKLTKDQAIVAIEEMLPVIIFDEVELLPESNVEIVEAPAETVEEVTEIEDEIQVPEIEIDNSYQNRYDFMNELEYSEMTAHQLSVVLFKELGYELESKIVSMATGSIVKTKALDELKDLLVETYPNIRVEELEAKLANALAITKQKHDKSTAMLDGNLLVYKYLGTDLKASKDELKNFSFMAKIGGDRHSLDTVILQSAFSTYKDEVAQGNLPITCNELNVAIVSMINKIRPATEENKKAIQNLF